MNNLKSRPLQEKDIPFMLEWMQQPDVNNFFRFNPESVTKESVSAFIKNSQTSHGKHFAVADINDEYLGTVSLKNIDMISSNGEFAIALREKARGKGIGTFALYFILEYAFYELELHKVYLNVYADNIAAIKLYEKFGFTCEGEFNEHIKVNGNYKNLKWFAIKRMEYNKLCQQSMTLN